MHFPFHSPLAITCTLFATVAPTLASEADDLTTRYQRDVAPFLEQHCFECHADGVSKGDFSLDGYEGKMTDGQMAERWHEVINVLNEGRMPPEKREQPIPDQKITVVQWVRDELNRAEIAMAGGGRGVLRRMNRREYEQTVEDLLGIPPIGIGAFAQDGKVSGLDNQGQGLFMSPYQMERYLDTALATLEIALPAEKPETYQAHWHGQDLVYEPHSFVFAQQFRDPDVAYREDLAEWEKRSPESKRGRSPPEPYTGKEYAARKWASKNDPPTEPGGENGIILYCPITERAQLIIAGAKLMVPLEIPQDGWYRVRVRAGVGPETPWDQSTVTVGLYEFIEGRGGDQNRGHNHLFKEEVKGTLDKPATLETMVYFEAGKKKYYLHKGNLGWETKVYDLPQIYDKMYNEHIARKQYWRGLLIESFEIEGPIAPNRTMEVLFPGGLEPPFSRQKAATALQHLARRAFRRPVDDAELETYLAFYDGSDRSSFLRSLQRGAAMILSSPKFIYLVEQHVESGQLSDHELATRLAYFLWSRGPDEKLLQLADERRLRDPSVLRSQVDRLLDAPESSAFWHAFARGWLGLDRVETIVPDRRRYNKATFDMPQLLIDQSGAFVEEIFRSNRSALEVIDSDWDILNAKLASYYEMDHLHLKGTELRPVKLEGEDRRKRGGVLAHASILTMTSNGTRTSPVVRGAWIVEHLLGRPPPPPPPSVSALEDIEVKNFDEIPVKDLIKMHTRDPNCAACHKHFDPYGMAFENYDAAGQWQDFHIKFPDSKGNNRYARVTLGPVDASGQLADGTTFTGPQEMRKLLLLRKDDFARNLARKLLAYAIGRPVEFSDQIELRRLQARFTESDYRLRPLVMEIVLSNTFRSR